MQRDQAIKQLIDAIVPHVKELQTKVARASWERNTTGSAEAAQRQAAYAKELRSYYADPERFGELTRLKEAGGSDDPILQRQLEMLYRSFLANQITPEEIKELTERETELGQLFNNFRASFEGRPAGENELNELLRNELDNARRQAAYFATKQIGAEAAPKVRELAKLRNRIAKKLGFRDFFAMSLEAQEIDEAELFQTLEGLAQASDAAFRAEKASLDAELAERFGVPAGDIQAWHYADPFFQEAPKGAGGPDIDRYFADKDVAQLSVEFYDTIGLEVRDILERSSLYEQPGKMQHAFCTNIDREGDVRILCNLKNNKYWMSTQLHELGHAVYEKYVDPGHPWLLRRNAHTMTTEAIAMLMGRLSTNAHWLVAFAQAPESEAMEAAAFLHRQEKRTQLIFSRWGMVMTYFERALYADPDQDLGKVWWSLVNRLQHVPTPEGADLSTAWASKIHVANYPVYYHNYILGELTASQLQANLEEAFGKRWMLREETGAWLWQRIFRPGATLPWNERLARATGEKLNPKHFVAQFVAE